MMFRRWRPLLLILVLVMIGACGCMNHKDYSDKILEELESRYEKKFEIVQLTYEVSGNAGNYYRAVCKDSETEVEFVACYYLNGSDSLLSVGLDVTSTVKKGEPFLVDEYCIALLNEQFAAFLVSEDLNIEYAIADTITVAHSLTIEDLSKGVEFCLSNDEFDIKATIYLFITDDANKNASEKAITDRIMELDLYRCNVDVIYVPLEYMDAIEDDYSHSLSSIEDKLEDDSRISSYRRYAISRGKGITLTEEVKGE